MARFDTSFIIYFDIDELTREQYYFNYFDGRIVLNEYDLQKRATKRHGFKTVK